MKTFTIQKQFNVLLEKTVTAKDMAGAVAQAEEASIEDFVKFTKGAYESDTIEKPVVIAVLG